MVRSLVEMTCSTRSRTPSSLLAALLAALLTHASAFGQAPTRAAAAAEAAPAASANSAEEAKLVFAEAQKAYALGRFQDAIVKYERVYELTNHPSLLFNLAQCHRQLNNYERAAFFYDRYLSTAKPPIPNEQTARDLLAEMSAKRDEARRVEAEKAAQAQLAQPAPPTVESKPVTSKWWFWVAIGAGVVAAGTITAVAVATSQPQPPATSLGTINF